MKGRAFGADPTAPKPHIYSGSITRFDHRDSGWVPDVMWRDANGDHIAETAVYPCFAP